MRYTFRQLTYFIAAGETGSIKLASERIYISQASISTAISQLERELDVQLFVRHHAEGLSLTTVGQSLLLEAKRLCQQAEGLYVSAAEAYGQVRGRLSVGCLVTLAPMILPELSYEFMQAHPSTEIDHIVCDQEQLLDGLRQAKIDVAITYDMRITEPFSIEPLARLKPNVLVGDMHALANRTSVSLEEVSQMPMVLLDLQISREYFLSLFNKAAIEPVVAIRSPYPEVVRSMVANGHGYTLANMRPKSNFALDGKPLRTISLAGDHLALTIGMVTLKNLRKPRLLDAFEAHCRAAISEGLIPGMALPG